jgi:hypothetical protein
VERVRDEFWPDWEDLLDKSWNCLDVQTNYFFPFFKSIKIGYVTSLNIFIALGGSASISQWKYTCRRCTCNQNGLIKILFKSVKDDVCLFR